MGLSQSVLPEQGAGADDDGPRFRRRYDHLNRSRKFDFDHDHTGDNEHDNDDNDRAHDDHHMRKNVASRGASLA